MKGKVMKTFPLNLSLIAMAAAMLFTGCATKEYVHEYVQGQMKPVSGRVDTLESRTDQADAAIKANAAAMNGAVSELKTTLQDHGERLDQLSRTALEAVQRAEEAGKMAQGKMVYEVVLTEDKLKFGSDKATLGADAKAILDEFAARLKQDNQHAYVEIQGHTDSRGEAAPNRILGEKRAQAVRDYLNMHGGIPLHKMSVISYGESAPVADNHYRDGRRQNRRVVLVVIQ